MKNLTVFAAALLATTVAMADSPANNGPLTREQVVAELVRARASGEMAAMNSEDSAAFTGGSLVAAAKTRAPVLAANKPAKADDKAVAAQ